MDIAKARNIWAEDTCKTSIYEVIDKPKFPYTVWIKNTHIFIYGLKDIFSYMNKNTCHIFINRLKYSCMFSYMD